MTIAPADPAAGRRFLLFGTEQYAFPVLQPLADAIRRRGGAVAWYLHDLEAGELPAGESRLLDVDAVRRWRPDAVFAACNWVPPFFPGLKVQVFHGFSVGKRSAERGHFRIRGLFDLYCTQGPATTTEFQRLQQLHGHFRAVETGWPKIDPLFAAAPEGDSLRPGDGRPVIAFGSTFTSSLSCAAILYPQIARMVASGEWYWLLTLHPKSPPELFERYRALAGAHARFVEPEQVPKLLRDGDVLLSDTSSLVEEFAVQLKPVVTFRNRSPKPHMLDFADPDATEVQLRQALALAPALREALLKNSRDIHPYRDGCSSDRVLDATLAMLAEGGSAGLAGKPWNLWRRLQIRAWMRHWRP